MKAMECKSDSSREETTDNELKKQQSKQEGKKKRTYEQKFCNAWLPMLISRDGFRRQRGQMARVYLTARYVK